MAGKARVPAKAAKMILRIFLLLFLFPDRARPELSQAFQRVTGAGSSPWGEFGCFVSSILTQGKAAALSTGRRSPRRQLKHDKRNRGIELKHRRVRSAVPGGRRRAAATELEARD